MSRLSIFTNDYEISPSFDMELTVERPLLSSSQFDDKGYDRRYNILAEGESI